MECRNVYIKLYHGLSESLILIGCHLYQSKIYLKTIIHSNKCDLTALFHLRVQFEVGRMLVLNGLLLMKITIIFTLPLRTAVALRTSLNRFNLSMLANDQCISRIMHG